VHNKMKKSWIVLCVILVLLTSACKTEDGMVAKKPTMAEKVETVEKKIEENIETAQEVFEKVPEIVVPEPKYIFIVIGDGMGNTQLKLGDAFVKIITGDMKTTGNWNDFDVQRSVKAGVESSNGGAMISTGQYLAAGNIA
jgi:hypothetical protein